MFHGLAPFISLTNVNTGGKCSVKEEVSEINSSVTLLIDYVAKNFLKCFSKFFKVSLKRFFKFLLGSFRFQKYQNKSSNFDKYFFSTDFAHLQNISFLKATLWNYFSGFQSPLMTVNTRGGSRAAATSNMDRFVIIVNGFQSLTIITKRSILDIAVVLDPPLYNWNINRDEISHTLNATTKKQIHEWYYRRYACCFVICRYSYCLRYKYLDFDDLRVFKVHG